MIEVYFLKSIETIKVTFLILHYFPVVVLPLCLPIVLPLASHGSPAPCPPRCAPTWTAMGVPTTRARIGGKAERHNGNSDLGYLVAFGWEPRPPRHNGGVTTGETK